MSLALTKPPITSRVNFRLITMLTVAAVPFLYFFFVIVRHAVTGGVIDRGTYSEVDLKSLGYFQFNEVHDTIENVPPRWRKLDGQRVLLEGFMWAPNEASGKVREFQLVYSIEDCCFGGPPKVQERVFAKVPEGQEKVRRYGGPVRVMGTLHVDAKKVAGQTISIFEMDVESVEPVKGGLFSFLGAMGM